MSHMTSHPLAFDSTAPKSAILEARLMWGTTVVAMRHFPFDHGVSVGEKGDLFVPEEVLGDTRIELLGSGGALLSQQILVDGRAPLSAVLTFGHVAHAAFDAFTVEVRIVEKEAFPVARFLEGVAAVSLGTVALSALAHGSLLGAFAFLMPAMGSDDADSLDRDKMLRMRAYLDAAAQREAENLKTDDAGSADSAESAMGGGKAMGAVGLMGKPEATSNGHFAVKKAFDAQEVTFNRTRELAEARDSTMAQLVGMLATSTGSSATATPWGTIANGNADANFNGNFWDQNIGDAAGMGGLSNLLGNGPGGGGDNRGMGVMLNGGIGNSFSRNWGTCDGDTCGTGSHSGKFTGGHKVRDISIRTPAPTIDGSIPPAVIQRIVRQNFGRFRNCYDTGLRTNPSLSGRVAVKFVIDRAGSVMLAEDGGSDLPDNTVRQCVVKSFLNLSFPAPDRGTVRVTYPIMFTPGEV